MAKLYANRIRMGLMTIDEVPARYREAVEMLLN